MAVKYSAMPRSAAIITARCYRAGGSARQASWTSPRPPMPLTKLPAAVRKASNRLRSSGGKEEGTDWQLQE
jgi:hypothetical protein